MWPSDTSTKSVMSALHLLCSYGSIRLARMYSYQIWLTFVVEFDTNFLVYFQHAVYRDDLSEQLHQSEKLMSAMSETWEEKLVKTERVHHERQQALEKMGISVQASGIQVEKNKFYLVNLNADPSLNELLVYYLKVYYCVFWVCLVSALFYLSLTHSVPSCIILFLDRIVLWWAGMTRIRSLTSNCLDWASRLNTVSCWSRTASCLWSHWGTRRASWTDLLLLLESYSVTAIGFSGATTISFASTAHVLVQLAKSKSSRTLILHVRSLCSKKCPTIQFK